jgi:4-hydroxythreonine-4-phosphate dehydrogenase
MSLPIIAVTMGDGAGVGPEIIVRALADPQVRAICRPIVIGELSLIERARAICGVELPAVAVASAAGAGFDAAVIEVIDLGLLPADLPFGVESGAAGDAAFRYVRRGVELALAGEVDAICTAPLNKAALRAGGHPYPGHTEMLAALTGTDEVSMMLSTERLNVIHVTTHIGLLDAVERIDPPLVLRTIQRGHEALVRSGIAAPRIAVCAINPHAGEGGLFGRGEEAVKIAPAIAEAQARGIAAEGPVPADTAFFRAQRGDFDLVVAMYHDQGHGPVKVLGIESGVNVTVGLPIVRTSVDHGTAFDIAGTGTADPASMAEALRVAAALAPPRAD